jgi:hypothetical protein
MIDRYDCLRLAERAGKTPEGLGSVRGGRGAGFTRFALSGRRRSGPDRDHRLRPRG